MIDVLASSSIASGSSLLSSCAGSLTALSSWLQEPATGDTKLLTIFVGVAAVSLAILVLIVLVVLVGLLVIALKAQKAVAKTVDQVKSKAYPIIEKTNGLIGDLTPAIKGITEKVHTITGHVEEIAGVVKDKVNEFSPSISAANETFQTANQTVRDANQKTHAQIDRVNGMVTTVLDKTVALGEAIQRGIRVPGREIAGMVSAAKSTLESFMNKAQKFTPGSKAPASRPPYSASPRQSNYRPVGILPRPGSAPVVAAADAFARAEQGKLAK